MQNGFLTLWTAALCGTAALLAQASAPPLAFEVASIKIAPPIEPMKVMSGQVHIGMSIDAARVDIGSLSLADLIRIAYKVKPYQVVGPEWMSGQRFDIMAKMPEGATKEQVPEMLQSLLAERFKLTVHRDGKEHAVYALIVGKNGPKLKEAEPDAAPAATAATGGEPTPAKPGVMVVGTPEGQVSMSPNRDGKGATLAGGAFGQMKVSVGEAGMMRMEFAKMSMPGLCEMLSRFADRPVVDMTGLKGNYQVALDLSMEEMRNVARTAAASAGIALPMHGGGDPSKGSPADAASTPSGNSVLAAVQQLGLKMEPRKSPVETIVVDHLEKLPTEN